nr:MAG: hypothetical protein 2 [Macanavirus sp.]
MDSGNESVNGDRHRERGRRREGNNLQGVKEMAVGQTAQKSQQGQGNSTMTNIAETQTITVTNNFNF